ncbi:hypothetical protein PoB_005494000 [Plakobranchus ocellatus]|uniref:Uncharacterized protein n=1 Tax=Plakobranchus ocellatus TaxID=259542 RepID=A0AAV4C6V4_9GAST|nr:hypothetical protein PoB_005494000 [Plakobranchus ocellatus]
MVRGTNNSLIGLAENSDNDNDDDDDEDDDDDDDDDEDDDDDDDDDDDNNDNDSKFSYVESPKLVPSTSPATWLKCRCHVTHLVPDVRQVAADGLDVWMDGWKVLTLVEASLLHWIADERNISLLCLFLSGNGSF